MQRQEMTRQEALSLARDLLSNKKISSEFAVMRAIKHLSGHFGFTKEQLVK